MKTRSQIVSEARRQREEITQYFNDVSHWNNTRGKTEGIIDPDPDGSMHRLGDALDKMLENEKTIPKCKMCGEPIRYTGKFWEHTNGTPRHPATPVDA